MSPATPDAEPNRDDTATGRLVLVTGPSGAGRSTAVNALEDMGFEAIDNLPLSLLPRLLDAGPPERPLVLGLDARNRDFSAAVLLHAIETLRATPGLHADVLYLEASPRILQQRYSETRRRHPLAPDNTPEDGIEREIEMLIPVRVEADILIDTSDLTPHDLRAELAQWFDTPARSRLAISLQSFSYKRGMPRGLDMAFDVRFLRNPYWEPGLRALNGLDPAVAAHVQGDRRYGDVFDQMRGLLTTLLPAYADEGKTHLTIGFGCTGGQHRSVAVTEHMAKALAEAGWQVSTRHREMERRAAVSHGASQA